MYPFGHALRTYPTDVDDLSTTAVRAAQALQSMYGIKYTVGTGAGKNFFTKTLKTATN